MSISGRALRCRDESDAGQALGWRVDAIVVLLKLQQFCDFEGFRTTTQEPYDCITDPKNGSEF